MLRGEPRLDHEIDYSAECRGERYEILRFAKVAAKIRQMHTKLSRLYSFNSFTVELLAAIALSSIVFYSFGKFTAGEFAAFFGALLMLIAPIKNLTAVNDRNQVGLSAAQSVFGLIDQDLELDSGKKIIKKAKGNIRFHNVSFKYESTKQDVLKDINLSIKAGEKIALVGKSGGGKTTLVNLIPKFYNIDEGKILLDGMDIYAGSAICKGPNNIFTKFYNASPVGITVEGSNTLTRSLIIFGQGLNKSHPYIYHIFNSLQSNDLHNFKINFNKFYYSYLYVLMI